MIKKLKILIPLLIILIVPVVLINIYFRKNVSEIENIDKTVNTEYHTADYWRTSTPEEQGVDSEKLYDLVKGIRENKTEIDSLVIVRNGYIITEAYFSGNKDSLRPLYSCTKSVTSALIGAAIEDGYIKDTNVKLLDIYSDMKIKNNNALKKQITLKHLLTMSSGFDWNEVTTSYSDPSNPVPQLERSSDTVQFMLDRAMSTEPGKVFNYSSGGSHLLSAIITKLSGKALADYAEDKLFKPLGITNKLWYSAQDGITFGGYGLYMRATDMAKLGYLFLKKGKWEDKQIIPEAWVEISTKKHIDADYNGTSKGYGYQWWVNSFGGYSARGYQGQYIIVQPELDMVVVFQSHLSKNDLIPINMMEENIIPAVKSKQPLPSNTEMYEKLKSICSE